MKHFYFAVLFLLATNGFAQFDYQKTWATYYFANRASIRNSAVDSQGNIVILGYIIFTDLPEFYTQFTTPNAHQTQIGGGYTDVFLAKFNPEGNLFWATYYGGSGDDSARGLALDSNDNIYISGFTNSNSAIATEGVFMTSLANNYGGFMSKFSTNGQLLWGTYFPESIADLCLNTTTNTIYIVGRTNEITNISSVGAYVEMGEHTSAIAPEYDNWNVFINSFDIQGNRIFGTYAGRTTGSHTDSNPNLSFYNTPGGFNVALDSQDDIILTGTASLDGSYPFATPGCHQPTCVSSTDAFISKFNASLTARYWSTYFGGNYSEGIPEITTSGTDVYLAGSTSSSNNIATVGSHQPLKGMGSIGLNGGSDGFLTKFNGQGVQQWGTYYGGSTPGPIDQISAISIKEGIVFIGGSTRSADAIATTGVYQESLIGDLFSDGFFAQFTTDGVRNWGSYFGGESSEGLTKILLANDSFYLLGGTNSATNIATTNALQPNINLGNIPNNTQPGNIFIAKFDQLPLGVAGFPNSNLQIAPNPNLGDFVLQGNLNNTSAITIAVYDIQGRLIYTNLLNSKENFIQEKILLGHTLTSGVYFVKVSEGNNLVKLFKMLVK